MAFRHALLGATDRDLAELFCVDVATVNRWKIAQPAFCESLKKGKKEADAKVANCLFGRATGYDHDDVDIRTVSVGDGCSQIVLTPFVKHHPPDVTAQIFWLKNRQPERFRDRPQVEVTVNNEVSVDTTKNPEEMTVPEMEAKLAKMRENQIPILNGERV